MRPISLLIGMIVGATGFEFLSSRTIPTGIVFAGALIALAIHVGGNSR